MLVYDLDQTDGADLPKEIHGFAKFEGSCGGVLQQSPLTGNRVLPNKPSQGPIEAN
jgi:hypothetical protein